MAPSVQKDLQGPDWPVGFIAVATPGVPVGIMSLVDPTNVMDPSSTSLEYTVRCAEIMIQAMKPGAVHGTQMTTGNIYVVRKAAGGSGNRDDTGSIVGTIQPGQTLFLSALAMNCNVWSPYRYALDADNAGDGAFVTLIIQ